MQHDGREVGYLVAARRQPGTLGAPEHMNARIAVLLALSLPLCLACNDLLTAKNLNQPDVERVFGDPRLIEPTIGSGYQQCQNSISIVSNSAVQPQLQAMALEVATTTGNNTSGMDTRQAIPRTAILNSPTVAQ